jgi:hypothetical protein
MVMVSRPELTREDGRVFYRVLRSAQPNETDFECDAVQHFRAVMAGQRPRYTPRNGFELRQWSGVSMFAALAPAAAAAREHRLGRFLARVALPPSNGRNVLFEPVGAHEHYIVWATPQLLLRCVQGVERVLE